MAVIITKTEIKRNLVGGLEVALFMPEARKRFGNSAEEAVRSFAIPLVLLPVTMLMVYLQPEFLKLKAAADAFTFLYCLRIAMCTGLFLLSVYWLAKKTGRGEHFWQFVIAANWLAIPACMAFMPVLWMLVTGEYSWNELYPFALCVLIYTYAFTAFMAACILRLPWEMGAFIAFIGFLIDNSTDNLLHAVNSYL